MTARQIATEDIKKDLAINGKCFMAFHEELNTVINRLVRRQLREQSTLSLLPTPSRTNSQLIAHCFFAKGEVKYTNYCKYYDKN